ncbi:unnamed protein product [Darwinula stevensoni]|uniref:Uncharacterized protein n=1 Tax=Darwinula stevensoni TaxID=69355 RepID=A0A7R8WYK7_9CRUS|nr:unnamed protein product [Darwinula stevensoni]CAG0879505.1 unnamed protein product [Darwinula stevensoni]
MPANKGPHGTFHGFLPGVRRSKVTGTMSVNFNDIIKQGYVRMKSRNLGLWRRRWVILRKASSRGPCRIDKYADKESAVAGRPPVSSPLPLNHVLKVERLPPHHGPNSFVLEFYHDDQHQRGTPHVRIIACETEEDADAWVKVLSVECQCSRSPSPTEELQWPISGSPPKESAVNPPGDRFNVYMLPCKGTSVRGECLLQVASGHIQLWDVEEPRLKLVSWPVAALRRYGRDSGKFIFEANKNCVTGEGTFIFRTTESEAIFKQVHEVAMVFATASGTKLHKSKSVPSKSPLPCRLKKSHTTASLIPGVVYGEEEFQYLDDLEGFNESSSANFIVSC